MCGVYNVEKAQLTLEVLKIGFSDCQTKIISPESWYEGF